MSTKVGGSKALTWKSWFRSNRAIATAATRPAGSTQRG